MSVRLVVVLSLTILWALLHQPAYSQTTLTNQDVISMVEGRLSPTVIKNAIADAPSVSFDLSVQGLLKLKAAGLDDQILEAMQARASKTQPAKGGPAPTANTATSELPNGVGVFCLRNGKYEGITPETGKGRMSASRLMAPIIVKQKNENKVSGGSAAMKTSDSRPKFLLHLPNRDITKLNMISVLEVRKDERVLFVVEGRVTGNIKQNLIRVSLSEPSPGYLEMSPVESLAPGEYAIVDYGAKDEPPTAWSFALVP